jgi:very-short-patch-repair endonuclease
MSTLSPAFFANFKNWCQRQILATIDDIFQGGRFQHHPLEQRPFSGQRRQRVAEYSQTIDIVRPDHSQQLLDAAQTALRLSSIADDEKERLREICRAEGLLVEGNELRWPGPRHGDVNVNLLYASDGLKPEIVWEDMLKNRIKEIKHQGSCLTYDKPIPRSGLAWKHLCDCWVEKTGRRPEQVEENRRAFRERLLRSIAEGPERTLFLFYCQLYTPSRNESVPMLIPQVYLHYDPYTDRQRRRKRALERQRMDFLIVDERRCIVLEVDGQQHYSSTDGRAEPAKYANMVREDRRLRLDGYEAFRFGGHEFIDETAAKLMLQEFFCALIGSPSEASSRGG